MHNEERKLKDDWRAKGNGRSSELAAFLNQIAYQLNNAEVISGGSCKVTDFGLRIEVDATGGVTILHPFKFAVTGTSTGSVESGRVWADEKEITITGFPASDINCASNTKFYVKIDWTGGGEDPTATWTEATAYPAETRGVIICPVIEFDTAGDATSYRQMQWQDILITRRPRWNELHDADSNTTISPDGDVTTDTLAIGETDKEWYSVSARASNGVSLTAGASGTPTGSSISADSSGNIYLTSNESGATIDITTAAGGGDIKIRTGGGTFITGLPTTAPAGVNTGQLYTQTAAQLGGSGTTKVLCVV